MSFIAAGKTNFKYLLAAVVLAAIAGAGIFFYQRYSIESAYQPIVSNPENNPVSNQINNASTTSQEKSENDCGGMQDPLGRDACYQDAAIAKEDPSVCEKIQGDWPFYSKNKCYSGVASAKQDPSACDKIDDQATKDNCYSIVASAQKDSSICDKIQNDDNKKNCYDLAK